MSREPKRRAGTRGAAVRASAPRRAPWLRLHADPDAPAPPWLPRADAAALALVAVLLAWIVLFVHRVGDYGAESDFYGAYAAGARLFQHGTPDASRYGIVGPVYDLALAVTGFVLRDLYLAGKVVSALAALALLVAWRRIARATAGPLAASWLVVFVAANPVFLRYGCAASTDMLAAAFQAGCLAALVTGRGRRSLLLAGALAALATLTRYTSAYLLPVAAVLLLARREALPRRGAALALFLGGFAAVALPWLAFSLRAGFVPGRLLFRYFDFYVTPGMSRNVQDELGVLSGAVPAARSSFADFLRRDPAALFGRLLTGVPAHLRRDAGELLGWPASAACVAGLALSLRRGLWRRLAPVAVAALALFLPLAAVFYSERYALPLVPAYLLLAAVAAASPWFALELTGARAGLKTLAAVVVLLLGARSAAVQLGRQFAADPVEAAAAGRVLAKLARPGDRVLSRKGHVGYYAGLDVVGFPRVGSLPELAAFASAAHARFLYYSWYEATMRPELAFLLDSTAAVPGLERVWWNGGRDAALYRIGAAFGRDSVGPEEAQRRAIAQARVLVRVLADSTAAPFEALLAADALDRHQVPEAIAHAGEAIRWQPRLAGAWLLMGDAQRAAGNGTDAALAYANAVALDPTDARARLALGWVQLAQGQRDLAARTWRPLAGRVDDPATGRAMVQLFASVGDAEAERAARSAAPPAAR